MRRNAMYSVRTDTLDRLLRIGMAVERQLVAICRDLAITRSQAEILAYLLEHAPTVSEQAGRSVGEVAKALQLRSPTVSHTISGMSSPAPNPLVCATTSSKDARKRLITLTPEGHAVALKYQKAVAAVTDKLCKGIRADLHHAIETFENRVPGVRRRRKRLAPAP